MESLFYSLSPDQIHSMCKKLNLGDFQDFYIIPSQKVDLSPEPCDLLAVVIGCGVHSSSNNNVTILFDHLGIVNTVTNGENLLPVHSEYAHVLELPASKTINKNFVHHMTDLLGSRYLAKVNSTRRNMVDFNNEVMKHWFDASKKALHEQEKIEHAIKQIPWDEPCPIEIRDIYAQILMKVDKAKYALKTFSEKQEYLTEMLEHSLSEAREWSRANKQQQTQITTETTEESTTQQS